MPQGGGVARWAAVWRVERSILHWDIVSFQIHLISPGCPWPNSALTVQKSGLKYRSSIHHLPQTHYAAGLISQIIDEIGSSKFTNMIRCDKFFDCMQTGGVKNGNHFNYNIDLLLLVPEHLVATLAGSPAHNHKIVGQKWD